MSEKPLTEELRRKQQVIDEYNDLTKELYKDIASRDEELDRIKAVHVMTDYDQKELEKYRNFYRMTYQLKHGVFPDDI